MKTTNIAWQNLGLIIDFAPKDTLQISSDTSSKPEKALISHDDFYGDVYIGPVAYSGWLGIWQTCIPISGLPFTSMDFGDSMNISMPQFPRLKANMVVPNLIGSLGRVNEKAGAIYITNPWHLISLPVQEVCRY